MGDTTGLGACSQCARTFGDGEEVRAADTEDLVFCMPVQGKDCAHAYREKHQGPVLHLRTRLFFNVSEG